MSPGERVSQVAHELLDPGPMSRQLRRDEYRAFIRANFVDTPSAPVFESGGTHCAIFARACLTQAGIMPIGRRPRVTAITTWLGVKGFAEDDPDTDAIEGAWIPADEWTPETGDVPYICGGSASTWWAAKNGHVFVLVDGSGPMWRIAQGGGGADGSLCRLSGPLNIFEQTRPARGAWRPALMQPPQRTTTLSPTFQPIMIGWRGPRVGELQVRLLRLGYQLPRFGADSDFGSETLAAVKAFQRDRALPETGIVDALTWQAIEHATEPAMHAVKPEES